MTCVNDISSLLRDDRMPHWQIFSMNEDIYVYIMRLRNLVHVLAKLSKIPNLKEENRDDNRKTVISMTPKLTFFEITVISHEHVQRHVNRLRSLIFHFRSYISIL